VKYLVDKVAIVTGASRGLGRDIALGLAQSGAAVVAAARTESERQTMPGSIYSTKEKIEQTGGRCLAVQTDVTNEESVSLMVGKTLDAFGRIDILVNNAGIAVYLPTVEMPLKRWDLIMKVNLYGTFLCTKAVLPSMIKQRSGCIINMSSFGRKTIDPINMSEGPPLGITAYETAKGGIEQFTRSLAVELSKYNICANCIKPEHGVATEGLKYIFPERDWKGWASSEMMVKAAIFLAKQDRAGLNGVVSGAEELAELYAGTAPWTDTTDGS
jgi:NAD(P)-dependent dehydrogenase (short-subunit alcohol dehydrogenase family)